jgi:transcriptional regulator with XRE-family HTH domain
MDTRVEPANLTIGERLREWRERRKLSQMALALAADVSARHLSFVETGRAQPGQGMLLKLAEELHLPLRERNVLLVAAGFAPVFTERRLGDASFEAVRGILELSLERHKPFPAFVVDRCFNVVMSNSALPELYDGVIAELMRPPVNVIRLMLHPGGMAPRIRNLGVWRAHFLAQMRRQIGLHADPDLQALYREALAYPFNAFGEFDGGAEPGLPAGPAVPLIVDTPLGCLSLIGATTVFGSPADVTLDEIALELMHPADAFTAQAVTRTA